MARSDQDREDLLAEARALVERCEVRYPGIADTIVVGFRRDGCASFYFGQDRAYHFNTQRQLRRAYIEGQLIKTERGRLVSLVRQRTEQEVRLVRHDLEEAEIREFLELLWNRLQALATAIAQESLELVGCVPADADVAGRAAIWLSHVTQPIVIADRPEVR